MTVNSDTQRGSARERWWSVSGIFDTNEEYPFFPVRNFDLSRACPLFLSSSVDSIAKSCGPMCGSLMKPSEQSGAGLPLRFKLDHATNSMEMCG